jgi:hypothetical protein
MTKDQIHELRMALFLAEYFIEEHYGEFVDSGQAEIDNDTLIKAREILKELEANL